MEGGIVKVSSEGKRREEVVKFEFGDPETRKADFTKPVSRRFVRIESTKNAGDGKSLAITEVELW
ncbi:hypothetical protein [Dyadobacter aurulentus]|uniref:hypothetical protein n=1 Tax=Dyadobacter sp. UC 10 TaxID=2605428 RepID=UPI0011F202D4|nr:hypothetical protein [Dyadobacter sp. UC 10]KAA0992700.1 hypothetical protein FXO21_22265 [Dyadobacter sp. UC 10]